MIKRVSLSVTLSLTIMALLTAPVLSRAGTTAQLCPGDGITGKRFEMVYVERTGDSDPTVEAALADLHHRIPMAITNMWMDVSRGTGQRPRWLCDNDRSIHLTEFRNAPDTLETTDDVRGYLLFDKDLRQSKRKYVVLLSWVPQEGNPTDADIGVRNWGPDYAVIALPTWNRELLTCYKDRVEDPAGKECTGSAPVVMHEMVHMLGAVNPNAPGWSPKYHTSDWREIMSVTNEGAPIPQFCDAKSYYLDCGRDSYWDHQSTSAAIGTRREWLYLNPQYNIYLSDFLTH